MSKIYIAIADERGTRVGGRKNGDVQAKASLAGGKLLHYSNPVMCSFFLHLCH